MFSHVVLGTNNIEKSKKFYDATMAVLGYSEGVIDEKGRCFYFTSEGVLGLTLPINGEPATISNGMTIGFKVASPEVGNQWHAVGIAHGGIACEEPPGLRVGPTKTLYIAYLRDPSGNKICVAHILPS